MANANVITQLEYKFNNLTGSETQAELLALKATADKYPTLDSAAVALLDAAITVDANALANGSSITEVATVAQAAYEKPVEVGEADTVMFPKTDPSANIKAGDALGYVDGGAVKLSDIIHRRENLGADEGLSNPRLMEPMTMDTSSAKCMFEYSSGCSNFQKIIQLADGRYLGFDFRYYSGGREVVGSDFKLDLFEYEFNPTNKNTWNRKSTKYTAQTTTQNVQYGGIYPISFYEIIPNLVVICMYGGGTGQKSVIYVIDVANADPTTWTQSINLDNQVWNYGSTGSVEHLGGNDFIALYGVTTSNDGLSGKFMTLSGAVGSRTFALGTEVSYYMYLEYQGAAQFAMGRVFHPTSVAGRHVVIAGTGNNPITTLRCVDTPIGSVMVGVGSNLTFPESESNDSACQLIEVATDKWLLFTHASTASAMHNSADVGDLLYHVIEYANDAITVTGTGVLLDGVNTGRMIKDPNNPNKFTYLTGYIHFNEIEFIDATDPSLGFTTEQFGSVLTKDFENALGADVTMSNNNLQGLNQAAGIGMDNQGNFMTTGAVGKYDTYQWTRYGMALFINRRFLKAKRDMTVAVADSLAGQTHVETAIRKTSGLTTDVSRNVGDIVGNYVYLDTNFAYSPAGVGIQDELSSNGRAYSRSTLSATESLIADSISIAGGGVTNYSFPLTTDIPNEFISLGIYTGSPIDTSGVPTLIAFSDNLPYFAVSNSHIGSSSQAMDGVVATVKGAVKADIYLSNSNNTTTVVLGT